MFRDFEAIISRFQTNPANAILYYLILIVAILMSLMLHEIGHGLAALWSGDPTAKMLGRLSLNPAKHLDPIGTIMMILFRFGWAKPVPINPRNFKNYRRDYFFVSIAGILVNLVLFLFFVGMTVLLNNLLWKPEYIPILETDKQNLLNPSVFYVTGVSREVIYSRPAGGLISSAQFIGFSSFAKYPALLYLQTFFMIAASINLSLALFNLLPVPPLDGYRLIDIIAFKGRLQITPQIYMIIRIVMLFLLFSGMLTRPLERAVQFIYDSVLKLFTSF